MAVCVFSHANLILRSARALKSIVRLLTLLPYLGGRRSVTAFQVFAQSSVGGCRVPQMLALGAQCGPWLTATGLADNHVRITIVHIGGRLDSRGTPVYRHHARMISSFVRALISAFEARRELAQSSPYL